MNREITEQKIAIIKSGASSVTETGVNREYVKQLLIDTWDALSSYAHVVFVIGGGQHARLAQQALGKGASTEQRDLVGMEVLVEHAHAVRECIFQILLATGCTGREAGELIAPTPQNPAELRDIVQQITPAERFLVVSGLIPKQSTDASAVLTAHEFMKRPSMLTKVDMAVLTNVDSLYAADPKKLSPKEQEQQRIRRGNVARLAQETYKGKAILESSEESWKSGSNLPLDWRAVQGLAKRPLHRVLFGNTDDREDINRFFSGQEPQHGTVFVPEDIETEYYSDHLPTR